MVTLINVHLGYAAYAADYSITDNHSLIQLMKEEIFPRSSLSLKSWMISLIAYAWLTFSISCDQSLQNTIKHTPVDRVSGPVYVVFFVISNSGRSSGFVATGLRIMPYRIVSCRIASYHISCHVMSCHVMSCHVSCLMVSGVEPTLDPRECWEHCHWKYINANGVNMVPSMFADISSEIHLGMLGLQCTCNTFLCRMLAYL